jgi:hypothetical protein
MNVDIYVCLWNEAHLLPFFLDHYGPACRRIVALDDGSDEWRREEFNFRPSLGLVAARAGLHVDAIQRMPAHGGSLRLWASRGNTRAREFPVSTSARLAALRGALTHAPRPPVGIGAPAKATLLLEERGVRLEYLADDTASKIGRYLPVSTARSGRWPPSPQNRGRSRSCCSPGITRRSLRAGWRTPQRQPVAGHRPRERLQPVRRE